ncbi:indolepyruvate ferredoxin oxidoreductase family protein [Streptomyces sp. NPDC005356]|uniref:indolepyruvate ferredoxin oxidoreductase family protein n=1 Tax=Streptomyces sp. NPDC005356 TaxID=3157167 RepID=UPI0033B3D92B
MAEQDLRTSLDDRYTLEDGLIHLTGIQALARLPLDQRRADRRAGRRTAVFISGYEGSPLAGYDLELARRRDLLDEHDIVLRPGVNEELAATAVQGSQLASQSPDNRFEGVTGIWYGKSPGLDRASDALRHNNLMGTHRSGGALALVGDDPAAKSSTVPGTSELLLSDLGFPTLYPADPQDALDLGLHAIALSRASGLWTALKIVTNVADGSGTVQVHPERVVPAIPDFEVDGTPFAHQVTARLIGPELIRLEGSRDGVRLEMARRYAAANNINRLVCAQPGDRIGIIAAGKTFLDTRQALNALGLDDAELERRGVRLLRLGMIHPLEPSVVERFAAGLREIIVVEEKRSFVETAVKDLLYGRRDAPHVTGKRRPDGSALFSAHGELDPDAIAKGLAARLTTYEDFPSVRQWRHRQDTRRSGRGRIDLPLVPLTPRTPYFCSGCPHNSSTKTPEGSLVGAGIGCHAMVLLMDEKQTGTVTGLTQMGGEGAQWVGMAPFLNRDHLLQNLGDGTFHHSGSLAVRAAVEAGVNITYKLLYNSAVAMTGGQQPAGVMTVPQITHSLRAEGVGRIIVTTENPRLYRKSKLATGTEVWHRDRLIEAQEVLAKTPGVTVLVHDQECATELRRKRKRGLAPDPVQRVVINERVCEGCGDCGEKSNCLSVQPVQTEFGRKTRIDQSSCNKDYSCLEGDCPSFLSVTPGKEGKRRRGRATTAAPTVRRASTPLTAAESPEPAPLSHTRTHTTRILGVGGTGVVTLAQILSMAATLAGRNVHTLDQTGLAQKGGAVVSDVKITDGDTELANKAAAGECDLYLGCDILVAADASNLAVADPARTVAVVSTSEVPTGRMIVDTSQTFPDTAEVTDRIRKATQAGHGVYLDARHVAETLFGNDQFANILLAGAAYQTGALPLPAATIEEAITLNGVKAEANLQAFRRGRQLVAAPKEFAAAVDELRGDHPVEHEPLSPEVRDLIASVGAPAASELARLVEIRVPDLIGYQDESYAKEYADLVRQVRTTEAERVPGAGELAEAVARNLHKLMAYKDEYEVARLSLDPATLAAVRDRFGPGARMSHRLHPPIFRALGLHRKISLGPWFTPVFRMLISARRLRGTPLDLFGYAHVRRVERELIAEYRRTVEELLTHLTPARHSLAVTIAALPDEIRGYEQIKLDNVTHYRTQLNDLRQELTSTQPLPAP